MLRVILPLALAIGLIWLLVAYAGLDFGSVTLRLSGFGLWWCAIGIATALQLALSTEKWLRALHALSGDGTRRMSFGTGFFYTSLSAVMSQFLTVYAASIAVRSIATRFHHKIGLGRGAASSGFEQLFDVAVLAAIAAPTAALIAFDLGGGLWFALAAAIAALIFAFLGRLPAAIACFRRAWPKGRIGRLVADASVDSLAAPRLSRWFFLLSLARYAVIFGRVAIICFIAGFTVDFADLLAAFNAGQLSQIVALTPGSIGVFEWSWSGVLAFRDVPIALAVEMAIVIRLATFLCFVALTFLSAPLLLAERRRGQESIVL